MIVRGNWWWIPAVLVVATTITCSDDDNDPQTNDATVPNEDTAAEDGPADSSEDSGTDLVDGIDDDRDGHDDSTQSDVAQDLSGDVDVVEAIELATIPGEPEALASDNIPPIPFPEAVEENYEMTETFAISFQEAMVVLAEDATVADVNEILVQYGATVTGALPGGRILLLRVESDNLENMGTTLQELSAEPVFQMVLPEIAGATAALPPSSDAEPWTWESPTCTGPATGGNWGLELVRAPQMWNLDDFVQRARADIQISAAVLDDGYTADGWGMEPSFHIDFQRGNGDRFLIIEPRVDGGIIYPREHGTFIAGIIGASWDNGVGVWGINPWVWRIYGRRAYLSNNHLSMARVLAEAVNVLITHPDVRAINHSASFTGDYLVVTN